jgi:hypothetical protein
VTDKWTLNLFPSDNVSEILIPPEREIQLIEFYETSITAVIGKTPDETWIALKPICDHLEIARHRQAEKIREDRTYEGRWQLMLLPSDGGEQETFCLALSFLNLWLASISPQKVRPEIQDRLIRYKQECAAVLYQHFFQKHGERTNNVAIDVVSHLTRIESGVSDLKSGQTDLTRKVDLIEARSRKHIPEAVKQLLTAFTIATYDGLCACCPRGKEQLATEFDHALDRNDVRMEAVWKVCHECNLKRTTPQFKAQTQGAFQDYQRNLSLYLDECTGQGRLF